MGFETVILSVVEHVLGTARKAEFNTGILYVSDISHAEAEQLWEALPCDAMTRTYLGCGRYTFTFGKNLNVF